MIICPNCETQNRLGSIFCRGCGTKLAIDDVNVKNFEEKTGDTPKKKKSRKKSKLVLHIVELVFLLLIALAVFLVFQAPELPRIETKHEAYKNFKKKLKTLVEAEIAGKDVSNDFTELEINSYVADLVGNFENEGKVALRDIFIEFGKDDQVKFYFNAYVFNQRIVASCEGKLVVGDKGLAFKPSGFFSARLGKLPYPMFLFKHMTKAVLSKQDEALKLMSSISSIEISDGKMDVRVGEK